MIKNKINFLWAVFSVVISVSACSLSKSKVNENWSFQPFNRPDAEVPIISPNANSTFLDPMSGQIINWEANDTFNPAAAVKGDSIYVLYRA